jgi:hypothetical protein
MTIDTILKGSTWTYQRRCSFLGEVNRIRKQDLPPGSRPLMTCYGTSSAAAARWTLERSPSSNTWFIRPDPSPPARRKNLPSIFAQGNLK